MAILLVIGTIITLVGSVAQREARRHHEYAVIPLNATDDPSKTLTISWMGPSFYPSASDGTWIQRFLEKRFNLRLKPIFLDSTSATQRVPLMIAGGDMPDVKYESDPTTVQRLARHGFLVEIPYPIIKKYAPTFMKYMNEFSPQAWLYSSWNGKNYGIPTQWMQGRYPPCPVWRKDWLDRVGIHKIPETLDEVEVALKAFRENDPDGNGKKDTYGTTCDMTRCWWSAFNEVYSAYGVMPYDWQLNKDGKVVWGGIQPEAKAAIVRLHNWYAQEMLDPDFVVDKSDGSVQTKFLTGKIGYRNDYAWDNTLFDPTSENGDRKSFVKLQPKGIMVPGPLPTGPDGKTRGYRVWGGGGNIIVFNAKLAKNPEKVIRVLKMFETMTTDYSVAIPASCGLEGKHWVFNDPKKGFASGMISKPPFDDANQKQKQILSLYAGGSNIGGFFCYTTAIPAIVDKYMRPEELAFRLQHCPAELGLLDVLGKPDVVPSAGAYMEDLRQLQTQVYSDIIRGNKPPSAFDDFAKEWRRRGGDTMTAEAEHLYQFKLNIYKELAVPKKFW